MADATTRREEPARHDVIVVGASAGGVHALQDLLGQLPAELPAALLVVLHMGATSHLAAILDRAARLPVAAAETGQVIERGRVYVAVPGLHLLVHDDHLLLRRGPRENLARPAIDPLFRSAACSFGARVVGVVLSGSLNDGTAGLRAIKRCGGVAVVQDPDDAAVRAMPESALRHVDIDHVVPVSRMGPLLAGLAAGLAGPTPEIPYDLRLEAAIAAQELSGMAPDEKLGTVSRFTCPECNGALWEIDDGGLLRYRCHVGHSYTGEAMALAQGRAAEELLWSLLRSHQQRAELARRMADQESGLGHRSLAVQFRERAGGYDEDADVLRQLLRERADATDLASAALEGG